ncbi:hypothetical protein VNO77_04382 [Canavalia gladiata]|uniref:Uncharacterized protein n=1 Tax=Canavalia gladiata TaxID=3824 RepID=A0AAN9N1J4_CANGL
MTDPIHLRHLETERSSLLRFVQTLTYILQPRWTSLEEEGSAAEPIDIHQFSWQALGIVQLISLACVEGGVPAYIIWRHITTQRRDQSVGIESRAYIPVYRFWPLSWASFWPQYAAWRSSQYRTALCGLQAKRLISPNLPYMHKTRTGEKESTLTVLTYPASHFVIHFTFVLIMECKNIDGAKIRGLNHDLVSTEASIKIRYPFLYTTCIGYADSRE